MANALGVLCSLFPVALLFLALMRMVTAMKHRAAVKTLVESEFDVVTGPHRLYWSKAAKKWLILTVPDKGEFREQLFDDLEAALDAFLALAEARQ